MSDRIVYLKIPERHHPVVTRAPVVTIGKQYRLNTDTIPGDLHGLCSGLDYNRQSGCVLPPSPQTCFLWDIDVDLTSSGIELNTPDGESIALTSATPITTSQFVWSHGSLSEPKIIAQESTPRLTSTAGFDFVFNTAMHNVQLGLLNLVETKCFAILKDGVRYSIRDSGDDGPVLYLSDGMHSDEIFIPILETGTLADPVHHKHEINLSQEIPALLNGLEVETLTVLEQYTSFFMQRSLPFLEENIWTPVCAPISWGWSMRVARHRDDDWCIVRQKLLMPTVGHNGLEMPGWEGNQLNG